MLLIIVAINKAVFAQKEISHYVLPEFVKGKVLMKTGQTTEALLNYNTVTEEMIFMENNKPMALDRIQEIDTVFVNTKKFIPVDNVFYEMLTNTIVPLFIQHKSVFIPPGNETGFGTTQTSAVTNFNDMKSGGTFYRLKLPDEFKFNAKDAYWLKNNGKYYKVSSVQDVQNVFINKSKEVADFAKTNKIKFKNESDVIKLIEFCNR